LTVASAVSSVSCDIPAAAASTRRFSSQSEKSFSGAFSAVTAGDHRQTPVTIKTMIRKGFMLLPKIRQKKAAESIDLKSDPIITKNLPAAGESIV
jgi:hypothetical protein